MLIFHQFPNRVQAEAFAQWVMGAFGLPATVYSNQEEINQVQPLPRELTPPIVLVNRLNDGTENDTRAEEMLANQVRFWGGDFAGM